MLNRKIFFAVCLAVSVVCLAAGYGLAGQWTWAAVAIAAGLIWLPAQKYAGSWLPFICLPGSISLAVVGCLNGYSAGLMILGSGAALAAWDVLLLDASLRGNPPAGQSRRYENARLQSLALALGPALAVVFLGRSLHFQIPFLIWVVFVALAVLGLDRAWGYIRKY